MGCLSGIIKTIMFIFNFACVAVGLALIIIGTIFYVSFDTYDEIFGNSISVVPIVLIVVGVIVFIISFLGCCGTIKTSKCMLLTYAIFLIVLLVAQLAIGIWGLVQVNNDVDKFKENISKEMYEALNQFTSNEAIKAAFDSIQSVFKCCGVKSYDDYRQKNIPIPGSCCGKTNSDTCPSNEIYNIGCHDKLFSFVHDSIQNISIAAICICGIELLGAIFGFYLSTQV